MRLHPKCLQDSATVTHTEKSVSDDDAKCVAAATVSSRLDCCNSVLCGTSRLNISKLHRAQNMLARAIQVGKEIRARNTSRRRVHFPTYAMLGHTKQRIGQIGRIYRCETPHRCDDCNVLPSHPVYLTGTGRYSDSRYSDKILLKGATNTNSNHNPDPNPLHYPFRNVGIAVVGIAAASRI